MSFKVLRTASILTLVFTVTLGIIYPVVVTGIAQVLFPHQANGSLIRRDGVIVGSERIGQQFTEAKYFWGRLSATAPVAYNAASSSGSNYGPLNPALLASVKQRAEDLRAADPGNRSPIPVDLVTASGSGLDPQISVAAAWYQVPRVARARGLQEERVRSLVETYTEGRQLGFMGEPRVNVLLLNLALDAMQQHSEVK